MDCIKSIPYIADAGGLEIQGHNLSFIIPNGYGDGDFTAYIMTREQHDATEKPAPAAPTWHFFTSFIADGGETGHGCYVRNAALYAQSDTIPDGRYGAFFKDGTIHLVKWD